MVEMYRSLNVASLTIFYLSLFIPLSPYGKSSEPITFNPTLWGISSVDEISYIKFNITGNRYYIDNILKDPPYTAHTNVNLSTKKTVLPFVDVSFGDNTYFEGITATFTGSHSNAQINFLSDASANESFIRFDYEVADESYAGFYLRLYERNGFPQFYSYFDATHCDKLIFHFKGATTDEIIIRLSDQKWENLGDAVTLGKLKDFITPPFRQNRWNRIAIPLQSIPSIDLNKCASIVFLVNKQVKGRFNIKNIQFECNDNVHTNDLGQKRIHPLRKAIWVWETRKYAQDSTLWQAYLKKLQKDGFTDIFLQLLYSSDKTIPKNVFGNLVSSCTKQSIKVHALDGNPEMALSKNHSKVLDIIHAVSDYNNAVPPENKFTGIHLDIEPYLLTTDNPLERKKILRNYIVLLRQCSPVTNSSSLEFGVSIPFWFDTQWYRGKSMAHYIIDIVDYTALMNYRTFAFGPNGALAHSIEEIEYAQTKNKKVFIGLETHRVQKEVYKTYSVSGNGPSYVSIDQLSADSAIIHFSQKSGSSSHILHLQNTTISNPKDISFYGKTFDDLEYISGLLYESYFKYDSFSGMAYHSLKSYLALKGNK